MVPPRPLSRSTGAPILAGSSSVSDAGQVVRSPATTSRPPPRSTNRFSAPPARPGGSMVSLRTTTARLSSVAGETRPTGIVSTWNAGALPMPSALVR